MAKKNTFLKALMKGIKNRINDLLKNPYSEINMTPLSVKYYKHLQGDVLHTHKLLGKKTWFTGGGEYLLALKEVFLEKAYFQHLPKNAFILDCGAHIGVSVIYLKSICPTANIIAFEPDRKNFELLKKNVESHQLQHVVLKNEAVWVENTMLRFMEKGNMGSKIDRSHESDIEIQNVLATRLRDYLDQTVDFLKIDIEGAEYEVIKDIRHDLGKVKRLFLEYHGSFSQNHELNEILNIITRAGFVYYIKEAMEVFRAPFMLEQKDIPYDLQLNIFCFRK